MLKDGAFFSRWKSNRDMSRAKTIQERLSSVKKVANFEIAALFSRRVGE